MGAFVAVLLTALSSSTAFATFPGTDGRVAYTAPGGIHTMEPDGTDVRLLRAGGEPSWSANGRWIVYTCEPPSQVYVQICMMRADGSNARLITPGGDPASDPSFAPGGGRVIFSREGLRTDPGGLFVIDTDGSHEHRLAGNTFGGVWAPDGKHIAYVEPGSELWLMRPNGSGRRLLYSGGSTPRYAPNSHSILFNANGTTMRMGAFGGNPHPINTGLGQVEVAPAGGCIVGTAPGAPRTSDLYTQGGRCPATGLLIKNAQDPSWQPLP